MATYLELEQNLAKWDCQYRRVSFRSVLNYFFNNWQNYNLLTT